MDFSDYKGIYVIAEVRDGKVEKVTGELLGQARKLAEKTGDPVEAVILGSGVKERAQDLIAYGADVVYVMESPLLAHYDGMAYEKNWEPCSRKRNRAPFCLLPLPMEGIWHPALHRLSSAV